MADVSPQIIKSRFPCVIEIRPDLHDHFLEGKTIFPAVEAMIVLSRFVKKNDPGIHTNIMTQVQFPRLLILEAGRDCIDAQIEISETDCGIRASLLTSVKTKTGAMTRFLEHAAVTFARTPVFPEPRWSLRTARKLERNCIHVPAGSIYRELIPFGPSYRNIVGDLSVAPDGALAFVSGGTYEDALLGSPFVLDALMHAACVWGQRFAGIVVFPVGMSERVIYQPTRMGESYLARIRPVECGRDQLIFDAWIFDQNGIIYESVAGLRMRDVTQGRMKAPAWIKDESWKKTF